MITKISLIALAVTILAPSPANAATCIDLPVCKKSGMADPCQKAVERWEANGIFETNGAATISRFAKSGSLSCSAALSCNSGGGFNRFIGSDIRRLFNSVRSQCGGTCGDEVIQTSSNCWVRIIACENCDLRDNGGPVGHVSTSAKPPTSTQKPSTPPPVTSSTKKTSSSSPAVSSTRPPVSSTKQSSAPQPSSTKQSSAPQPSATSQKPDPPATTKHSTQPSATSKPNPNQEETDTENAENANDDYQKDPTNKSLAEKLKNGIERALDSTKKAIDDAVDEAVKGAQQGLQNALQDALAKAAAAAAAVAAAMEAVSSAKDAVKQAKQNKPSPPPTQNPTTQGPTTTFSSTISRSSTSSSSSSSSTCICLSCAEENLNLGKAPEKKRSSPNNAVRMDVSLRRRAGRTTHICEDWAVPDYNSWSREGGNTYRPFYDFTYSNLKTCTDVNFELTSANNGRDKRKYATEHIYEIQMVKQFLTYMWLNDAGIVAWRARNPDKTECELWTGFLWEDAQGKAWWDKNIIPTSPIEQILQQLSGGGNEMVYLEDGMNTIKGVMFGDRRSWSLTLWPEQLAFAAKSAATVMYLQNPGIKDIYHTVSGRMHSTWDTIDIEVQDDPHPDVDLRRADFANGYLKWEMQFIEGMEAHWSRFPGNEAKEAEDKILAKRPVVVVEKKVAENIRAHRVGPDGKFNPVNLQFAQGLLSWYTTGPRPT